MAKKNNLRYNPETLEYEKEEKTSKEKYLTAFTIFVSALVIYGILFIVSSYVAETPTQRKISRENKILLEQYKRLKLQKNQTDKMLAELSEKDKNIYRAVFETEPEQDTMLTYNPYDKFTTENINGFSEINQTELNKTKNSLIEQTKTIEDIKELIRGRKNELKYIPSIKPIRRSTEDYIVYGFGNKLDPFYKSPAFHFGIDFTSPEGTKVYATADGKVVFSGRKKSRKGKQRGMGIQVRIKHGKKYTTVYAHLEKVLVHSGKMVKRGDVIGTVGNTGKSFVSHLHYEVIMNGKQVDPINYFFIDLNPKEYEEFRKASSGGFSLD